MEQKIDMKYCCLWPDVWRVISTSSQGNTLFTKNYTIELRLCDLIPARTTNSTSMLRLVNTSLQPSLTTGNPWWSTPKMSRKYLAMKDSTLPTTALSLRHRTRSSANRTRPNFKPDSVHQKDHSPWSVCSTLGRLHRDLFASALTT